MMKFIGEAFFLLGKEKKYLPWLICLFLLLAVFEVGGLALIGLYVKLISDPASFAALEGVGLILFSDSNNNPKYKLATMGYFLVGFFLIKILFSISINYLIARFGGRQQLRLQTKLMYVYQRLPYVEYVQRNSAEYVHSIQNLAANFGNTVQIIAKLISELMIGLVIIVSLAFLEPTILFTLLTLLGIVALAYDRFSRQKIVKYSQYLHDFNVALVKSIREGIDGLKETRILGVCEYFYRSLKRASTGLTNVAVKNQVIGSSHQFFSELILVTFGVIVVLIWLRTGQDFEKFIPIVAVFALAGLRIKAVVNQAVSGISKLRFAHHGTSIVYNDLRSVEIHECDIHSDRKSVNSFSTILLSKVNFSYPNGGGKAIDNVSFALKAGESVGIIGPSGSGKTTLVDIVLGLLMPDSGDLIYNKEKMSYEKFKQSWVPHVAYLPQEGFLVDDTMRANIALGVEVDSIIEPRLLGAIKQAKLTEVINQLPDGLETILGERGVRLSGGQRQRVALARAFYFNREVLVLDEATSALDNETEQEIIDEIKMLKGIKTLIIVAHRLTTIAHCDRVYRLVNGQVVREGKFEYVSQSISME